MHVLWVSLTTAQEHTGGAGTYSRSLLEAFRAIAGDELTVIEPARPLTRREHRLRQVRSMTLAALRGGSAKLWFDRRGDVRRKLASALQERTPALVVFDGTSAAAEADLVPPHVPRLLVVHNVEGDLYAEQLAKAPGVARWLLEGVLQQSRRHRAFELRQLGSSSGLVFISTDDARRVQSLLPREVPHLVVPPTFAGASPAAPREPSDGRPLRLGFLGKMGWWPNREAVDWFLTDVWPRAAAPALELHLYGEGSEALTDPKRAVTGHGFVPDLRAVWGELDVFINPMQSGGGTNVKVCEALFHGLPVLSTPRGLRGLPDFQDPAVRVCPSASEWREQLDPARLTEFSRLGPRPETRAYFSADRAQAELRRFVDDLVGT